MRNDSASLQAACMAVAGKLAAWCWKSPADMGGEKLSG
jgi:hypothetical protein